MDAFKTVRAFNNPEHEDNWLDKVGYTQHARSSAFYDVGKKKWHLNNALMTYQKVLNQMM